MTITESFIGDIGDIRGTTSASSAVSGPRPARFQIVRTNAASREEDPPAWLTYLVDQLNYLDGLEADDPAHADPAALSRAALEIVDLLQNADDPPAPSINLAPEGNVQFSWYREAWDLEIEILPKESFVWARDRSSGQMIEGPLTDYWAEVISIVRQL